jgi:hypothetical protein
MKAPAVVASAGAKSQMQAVRVEREYPGQTPLRESIGAPGIHNSSVDCVANDTTSLRMKPTTVFAQIDAPGKNGRFCDSLPSRTN